LALAALALPWTAADTSRVAKQVVASDHVSPVADELDQDRRRSHANYESREKTVD
jgi:hypothetical protein